MIDVGAQMRHAAGVLVALAAWLAALPGAAASVAGAARVVDGDTLVIADTRVRLLHIDAPETGQTCGRRCGAEATRHLVSLVGDGPVRCSGATRDAYDRLLAVCEASTGTVLNRRMVADGHAMVFRRYGDTYAAQERAARAAGRGLWSSPDPVAPWDYRARRWTSAAAATPRAECPIKGNINANGVRIYHLPQSQYYDRTRISPARGERWFCDENAARAAGWRAARGS